MSPDNSAYSNGDGIDQVSHKSYMMRSDSSIPKKALLYEIISKQQVMAKQVLSFPSHLPSLWRTGFPSLRGIVEGSVRGSSVPVGMSTRPE